MGDYVKIFMFNKSIAAEPGQFVFTWIPRKGEKPFSIAYDRPLTLAVRKVDNFTSRVYGLDVGDELMVRGPYGRWFPVEGERPNKYLVAGGTGAAPIRFQASRLKNPKIFLGAKTKKELLFEDELASCGELFISTDDGSKGSKGFVTDALERYLVENGKGNESIFYNCGPEVMMRKAVEIESAYALPGNIFASVERYTPCGVGICGRCSMDGFRTCVDGPVYTAMDLKHSKDFGNFKRDRTGKKVPV
jgi:dihydroorotate dehydrogenase electron transfer subunit